MMPVNRRLLRSTPLAACLAIAWVACGDPATPPRRDTPTPDRVAKAVIVIHGVGNQTAGYSQPLQDGLHATMKDLHFIEVLWSDLGSMLRQAPAAPQSARDRAEKELMAEIDAAEKRAIAERSLTQDEAQLRSEYAAARGFVGPIVQYEFLSPTERVRIQQRLRDALDWAAAHADRTHVVAHSLGSVIAFDALHSWEGERPASTPAQVALLTTMGSPLLKRVFAGHRGRPVNRPANVGTWINYYSPTDPIAAPLDSVYSDVTDHGIRTSVLPLTAHSAYWTHQDVWSSLLGRLQ